MKKLTILLLALTLVLTLTACGESAETLVNPSTQGSEDGIEDTQSQESNTDEIVSESPGLTVTESELFEFFKEIFIEGEIRDRIRFIRGENTPITDENGDLIIIGQNESEHEYEWFYKIEPKYSIDELKKMCSKYFTAKYLTRMDAGIDNNFRIENDELYFSMNDTIMQDNGEYYIDTFNIVKRDDLSVTCQIEILQWDVIITEYIFTYEDGNWKLSDEYLV